MNCVARVVNPWRLAAATAPPGSPFLPRPWIHAAADEVRRDVTLRLGDGIAHRCEQTFNRGEAVFVRGLVEAEGRSIRLAFWHRVPSALLAAEVT